MLKQRRNRGFSLTEVMLVGAIVTGMSTGAFVSAKNKALVVSCQNNLTQINLLLEMHMMDTGRFPKAAFYPKDADKDPDSIKRILNLGEAAICPAASDELRKKQGLTYIWNDEVNGKTRTSIKDADKTWLMMEMNAVTDKVPAAHGTGYNILFVDGHVSLSEDVPDFLSKAQKEVLRQILNGLLAGRGDCDGEAHI